MLAFTQHGLEISPSCSFPSSAACPVGRMVLTKIPIMPLGESRPPTMLKPRLFFPGPFSKTSVWKIPLADDDAIPPLLLALAALLFRGKVQNCDDSSVGNGSLDSRGFSGSFRLKYQFQTPFKYQVDWGLLRYHQYF